MRLKELRISLGLTQIEASRIVNIPLRTYQNYENDLNKENTIKYQHAMNKLSSYFYIDEDNGILEIDQIIKVTSSIFDKYKVEYCYLFGSYAKGNPKENSDIDLLISTPITGIEFFGLIETLRIELKKRVDVLTLNQLENNLNLIDEILKQGIKIYG